MNLNHIKTIAALIATLALSCIGSPSYAAVIDFNTAIPNGSAGTDFQSERPYEEDGYVVEAVRGAMFFLSNQSPAFPGVWQLDGTVLEFNDNNPAIRITRDDGATFDLFSILTGSLGRSGFDDGNFILTGAQENGDTVSRTIAATSTITQYTFSGFTDLTSLFISSSDGYFPVMDDIVLSDALAVPEPATLMLLSAGAIGFSIRRRRKYLLSGSSSHVA